MSAEWIAEEGTNTNESTRWAVREAHNRTDPLYFRRGHDAMRVCSWLNELDEAKRELAALEVALATERATAEGLREDIRFLLSFVPPWAKDVPEGLDPTFYGTLSAAGDREVKERVDSITARIAELKGGDATPLI